MQLRRVLVKLLLILVLVTGLATGYASAQAQSPPPTTPSSAPSTPTTPTTPGAPSAPGTPTTPGTPTAGNTTPPALETRWGRTCWMCDFLDAVNQSRQTFGLAAFELVADSVVPLVTAILGVWILLQAARLLMPFGPMDGGAKTMTSVFARIILAIAILAMVRNYPLFWNFQNAFIDGGLQASGAVMDAAIETFAPGGTIPGSCLNTATTVPPAPTTPPPPPTNATVALLAPLETQRNMDLYCTLSRMQSTMGVGMDVGIGLLIEVIKKPFWAIIQGVGGIPVVLASGALTKGEATWVLMRLFAGFILMGVFGLASFLMVFRFIDVVIKWTVMTILAPALMALFVFPKTRQIAFGGMKMMLAEALTLIFMAIIMGVMVSFFNYVLAQPNTGATTFEELSKYELKKGIAEPAFWYLLTIGLMTIGLLSQAAAWAGYAVSLPAMMQLPNVGTMAADAIQGAVGRLAARVGDFAYNRKWNRAMRMNRALRGELLKPGDHAARTAARRPLNSRLNTTGSN